MPRQHACPTDRTICVFVVVLPHHRRILAKEKYQVYCSSIVSCVPLGTLYCAVRSYSAKKNDEVSVSIGSVVEVLTKSDNGWWLVRYLNHLVSFHSFIVYLKTY